MSEKYNPYEVPIMHVAAWLAKINLSHLAFSSSMTVIYNGWGDSLQELDELSRSVTTEREARNSPVFDQEMLRGVRDCFTHVTRNDLRYIEDITSITYQNECAAVARFKNLQALATQSGLLKIGALQGQEAPYLLVPACKVALAYKRKDIREPLDRSIFEYEEAINAATKNMMPQIPYTHAFSRSDGTMQKLTPYGAIDFMDIDKPTVEERVIERRKIFWEYLLRDFSAIDRQAISGNSETATENQSLVRAKES